MTAIQKSIFQPNLSTTDTKKLEKEEEIQTLVLSKIYSFLKSEDRKVVDTVCKDWQQILHSQMGCMRLMEFIQEYCDRHAPIPKEYADMIGELKGQLTKFDAGSLNKTYKDQWYLFAKRCSSDVHSVVWIERIFKEHHFLKLYNCINLLEQISGKNALVYSKTKLSNTRKLELQKKLLDEFLTLGQIQAAADIFVEMEQPSEELGKTLIRRCRAHQEYKAAIEIAKKVKDIYNNFREIITELAGRGKYEMALDLIQSNDQSVNAASMMLILCRSMASHSHPIHKISDDMAKVIIERMDKISFDRIGNGIGVCDAREDLMVFLVDELLKRGMIDQAIRVYIKLGSYLWLSKTKEETLKKIQQYPK